MRILSKLIWSKMYKINKWNCLFKRYTIFIDASFFKISQFEARIFIILIKIDQIRIVFTWKFSERDSFVLFENKIDRKS